MLNPQFVAGEHGLFGGHKSEDIRTFFSSRMQIEIHIYFIVCNTECMSLLRKKTFMLDEMLQKNASTFAIILEY